ncbi:MAG: radical SAM protein [Deltaproteobacteria bacterium]
MDTPRYRAALETGILEKKARQAGALLKACRICPRACGVDRLKNKKGFCRTGRDAVVCSTFAHHGEEPPVSGSRGSGTIFFSHCNMRCVYCQNYRFSQEGEGRAFSARELADAMLRLERLGSHNINLVTPTHVMPQIVEALFLAARDGLSIPLVYNTSGYETRKALRFLDGIVDIYLTDMRYADAAAARRYSGAPDYPRLNRQAVREMFRQRPEAAFDAHGIMTRGLIVRHLVLPGGLAGTDAILAFAARQLSRDVHISLMSQYFPAYEALSAKGGRGHPPLARRISLEEYEAAAALLEKYGLTHGWVQESRGLLRFAGTRIKKNT